MENKAGRKGPRANRTAGSPALSASRAAVLESLQARDGATTAAALAGELDLHVNTIREHLEDLVGRGLAVRTRAGTTGPGRPAWTYAAAATVTEPDARVREYAGLAAALAGHLARTSADPVADAQAAGRGWGLELMAEHDGFGSPPHRSADPARSARRRVVALLDALGFAPDAGPGTRTVALRRCPLLDAARRYPDVVCGVHLGLVGGALEWLAADPAGVQLEPFAEPGACRLVLTAAETAAGPVAPVTPGSAAPGSVAPRSVPAAAPVLVLVRPARVAVPAGVGDDRRDRGDGGGEHGDHGSQRG